jgi:hypothetical protein
MKIILIYISQNFKNKHPIEENIKEIKKIYCSDFDLNILKKILNEYELLIYLDDNTNYNFDNLLNDINCGLKIFNNNNEVQQVLFDNYIYTKIDADILNENKNYFLNEITIFKELKPKYCSKINYVDYVNNNFDRLFIPSIIKTSTLINYNEKLINNPYYESLFLKKNNVEKYILNKENKLIFNKSINFVNINENLTIVTGYIMLSEKKIQKYKNQTYEYLDSCNDTLKINVNMVIYISEELHDFVLNKRKEFGLLNKTKIIKINIEKHMYFYNKLNIVEENVKKNHENYSSAKKILSVMSRYNYLKETIENNYFNTKYIAWLDFGASHIVSIPDNIIFNDNFGDKIRIGWIARHCLEQFNYNYKVLSGGFYIGKNESMLELIKLHNYYFDLLMKYGFTINDDKLLFFIFESNPFLFSTYFSDYKHIIIKSQKI